MSYKLSTGAGYDDLNAIRDRILALKTHAPLRQRYRELRRALANVAEDVRVTCCTSCDVKQVYRDIGYLRQALESIYP